MMDKPLTCVPPDTLIDEAWLTEALRRLEEMENGTAVSVPVEDAIDRARSAIR